MSNFGADIFDDEPPSKPPARKPRKSAAAKAPEPETPPATGESAAEPQPKKRAPRRRKTAGADDAPPATAPVQGSPAEPEAVFSTRSAEPEAPSRADAPAASAEDATGGDADGGDRFDRAERQPRRRGRRRGGRSDAVQETSDAQRQEQDREPPSIESEPRHERRSETPAEGAPTAAELDDEGAGFGVVPHDDVEAEAGETRGAGEPFPTFGGERRGRRRRRRRGRGRHGDDRAQDGAPQDGAAFPRGEGDELPTRDARGPFPRDPEGSDAVASGHDPRPEHARAGGEQRSRQGGDGRDDRHRHGAEGRDDRSRRGGDGRDDRPRREHFRDDRQRHGGDFRDDAEDHAPRPPRRSYADFKPATPPPPAPTPRRIAILLDAHELEAEAHSLGGEISYRRLRNAIAGHDEVVHAVCFASRELPEVGRRVLRAHGFAIEDCDDAASASEALAAQLADARWPVDVIVVAGTSRDFQAPHREDGPAIELAGLGGNGNSRRLDRTLLRNCMFVP